MTQFIFLLIFVDLILIPFLLLVLGYVFLTNRRLFISSLFPKTVPNSSNFLSKNREDGEMLIVYLGTRIFLFCLLSLVLFWIA